MSKKKNVAAPEAPANGKEEREEQAVETNDWRDKYLRALAELDNVRKRLEREHSQVVKYALEDTLRSLLPVFDALHFALDAEGDADAIREGVELAVDIAHKILGARGFMPIEALHKPFDPRWHEAVGMEPCPEHPPGTVIREERRGYRLHDRVLRPSRVHISIELPVPAEEAADEPKQEEGQEEGPDQEPEK